MKRKSQNFKEKARKFVNDIFNLYDSLNHELIINDLAVNCDKVLVRNISLDNDINFYFGSLNVFRFEIIFLHNPCYFFVIKLNTIFNP